MEYLLPATSERVIAYKAKPDYQRYALGKVALPAFALLRSGDIWTVE